MYNELYQYKLENTSMNSYNYNNSINYIVIYIKSLFSEYTLYHI